jgi:hypothetical protein
MAMCIRKENTLTQKVTKNNVRHKLKYMLSFFPSQLHPLTFPITSKITVCNKRNGTQKHHDETQE